ncbi:MAG TPA: hypothetical protein VFJ56_04050 [Nitrospira sp.]|nr:hypothetical protein [Nitrospira sp.]
MLAARALREFVPVDSQAQAKRNVLRAIEAVAKRLGNTKAVCRKCYIHPGVLNAYLEGRPVSSVNGSRGVRSKLSYFSPEEAAVLALLRLEYRLGVGETACPTSDSLSSRSAFLNCSG